MVTVVAKDNGAVIAVGEYEEADNGYVVGGIYFQSSQFELVEETPPDADYNSYRWNGSSFDKVETELDPATLEAAKADKNRQINRWREEATFTVFKHLGKDVACDVLSRSDIDAVAAHIGLTGQLPTGFPGGWKCVDNSIFPIPNVDAFKSMHRAMVAQGTLNFNKSQSLKATLANAKTLEEIDSITW